MAVVLPRSSRPVSDLSINISKLSEGTHKYTLEAEAESIGLDKRFAKAVTVAATLEKTGHQMHLRTELQARGRFACDRCLDDFDLSLSAHYQIVYTTENGVARGKTGEEIQFLSSDTTVLDLGEDVRQYLILAIPQKLLCREDCQGICPVCGANKNKTKCSCAEKDMDPRWEGLRKAFFN